MLAIETQTTLISTFVPLLIESNRLFTSSLLNLPLTEKNEIPPIKTAQRKAMPTQGQ